jgi:HPt (histidine-containing phosphotransfer) domain-containing protein
MNDYVSKPFEPADLIYKILKGTGEKITEPATTVTTATAPVQEGLSFDVVYRMFSGNKSSVKKLLKELVKQLPQKLEELHRLADEKKWNNFYILAHQVKFNLSVAGLPDASQIAKELEMDARQMINLDNVKERVEQIQSIYLQNVHYIEEHLANA